MTMSPACGSGAPVPDSKHARRTKTRHQLLALSGVGIGLFLIPVASSQQCDVVELYRLAAADGDFRDGFGAAVAVSAGRTLVGSVADDDLGVDAGAAYLFDTRTGELIRKLLAPDGRAEDEFGFSVAVNDTYAVVGAPSFDAHRSNSGAIFVFDSITGEFIREIALVDGAADDLFGFAVAIHGALAVIGAPLRDDLGAASGAAFLYDLETGQQQFIVLPQQGSANHQFGYAVGISESIAVIGSPRDDINGFASGSAYLFEVATGNQLAKLVPDDGAEGDWFARSVAVDEQFAVVGAWRDQDNGFNSGSAYLFEATTGQPLAKLTPDDGKERDEFGWSVAVTGPLVVIGAPGDDDRGSRSGSVYLYDASSSRLLMEFNSSDGASGDDFGTSVAATDNRIVAGAYLDDVATFDTGSAYLFEIANCDDCLALDVENLVAGGRATITITRGTPDARAVTVYGLRTGETIVNGKFGYCAIFGIDGITAKRVIGGLDRTFDANGVIAFGVNIPGNASGLKVFFQSAERNTCPDECVSNLIEMTVQ